jgi:hypothetical protein
MRNVSYEERGHMSEPPALPFLGNTAKERAELLWIASTYLVGKNESGNQKGNLSYLAGTKKRSDSLIESHLHKALHKSQARADEKDARALFFKQHG